MITAWTHFAQLYASQEPRERQNSQQSDSEGFQTEVGTRWLQCCETWDEDGGSDFHFREFVFFCDGGLELNVDYASWLRASN